MKRLLLLGAGHAHARVLLELSQQGVAASVTCVAPSMQLVYSGMTPGWLAGHYRSDALQVDLGPLARAAGVRLVRALAVGLDPVARRVTLSSGETLPYDLLSLDVGATQDRDELPGSREHALHVRPLPAFVQLMPQLLALAEGQELHVAVVGGGAGGCELAMALAWRLRQMPLGGRVTLVSGMQAPGADYPPMVRHRLQAALRRMQVTVLQERAVAVEAGAVKLANGARLACDAPVIATGVAPHPWLRDSGLARCPQGFVHTGPTLQSLSHPEVLAVGDCATRSDRRLPRSGVYAVRAGPPLVANLRALLSGGTPQPHQPPRRTLNLLACGERRAILSWGPLGLEGAWAWRWKDRIDQRFLQGYRDAAAQALGARAGPAADDALPGPSGRAASEPHLPQGASNRAGDVAVDRALDRRSGRDAGPAEGRNDLRDEGRDEGRNEAAHAGSRADERAEDRAEDRAEGRAAGRAA